MTRPLGANTYRARAIFLEANGELPLPCSFCEELVYEFGKKRHQGVVHHVDEDPTNDVSENLQLMHHLCHRRHHTPATTAGVKRYWAQISDEERDEFRRTCSESQKGQPRRGWDKLSEEQKKEVGHKISAGKKGKVPVSAIRLLTCECGRTANAGNMKIHHNKTGHALA